MKDDRLVSCAALAAREARASALAAGHAPGAAFEIACAAYTSIQPATSMWESQAIVAAGIGIWRRDNVAPPIKATPPVRGSTEKCHGRSIGTYA
jgi:hypothetical protein